MDTVRERAHQIWIDREANGIPGTAESDWTQAEEELAGCSVQEEKAGEPPPLQKEQAAVAAEVSSAEHQGGTVPGKNYKIGMGHEPPPPEEESLVPVVEGYPV